MLISIDHGNKQIKTNHRTFVSGLRESDTKPPFGKDVLFYKGKYYTLTDQRIPYMRDKTADERYFKKVPANDSIAHKGRTVLSALNYKLNALCNVALYHDTPYGETHKNQLQRYYTTIYCDCQVRKVYI